MIKKIWIVIVLTFALSLDISSQENCGKSIIQIEETTIPCPSDEWLLVFEDNFDNKSLDTSVWARDTGNPAPADRTLFPVTYKKGQYIQQPEAQLYRDENVELKNGKCIITAKKESATYRGIHDNDQPCMSKYDMLCGQQGGVFNYAFDYTSGFLRYKSGYSAKEHLKIEARIKLPLGTGLFPAFWSFTGREELDFFELFGQPEFPLHAGIIEWGKGGPQSNCSHNEYEWARDNLFHLYTVELTPYWLKIYVDNELMVTISKYSSLSNDIAYNRCGDVIPQGAVRVLDAFPTPRRLYKPLINLAIYDWVDEKKLPAKLEVDYMKMYQKEFCGLDDKTLVISKDTTLTAWERHEYKSIKVTNNSRLNIYNTNVSIASGGNIMIENGSALHLGKSTITANCDTWKGIVVESGGKLHLGNDVVIEKAETGVFLHEQSRFVHKQDGKVAHCNIGLQVSKEVNLFEVGSKLKFVNNQRAILSDGVISLDLTSSIFSNNNVAIEARNDVQNNIELCTFKGNLINLVCSDCPEGSNDAGLSIGNTTSIVNKLVTNAYIYNLSRL